MIIGGSFPLKGKCHEMKILYEGPLKDKTVHTFCMCPDGFHNFWLPFCEEHLK
jgi:hypothetical protein